ncbi:MAG TPA: hypothetical protein DCY91_27345 [Cyanobacteria bacterium UBA11370]|nr:hypothetical protein [Cyanobacteria bacterium UBA11370]HBY78141.1 hypothetical protein [Cyanobacteria bacterium UBA11148]
MNPTGYHFRKEALLQEVDGLMKGGSQTRSHDHNDSGQWVLTLKQKGWSRFCHQPCCLFFVDEYGGI